MTSVCSMASVSPAFSSHTHTRTTWIGADAIALEDEKDLKNIHSPFEPDKSMSIEGLKKIPLLEKVMENGKRTREKRSLEDISAYLQKRMNQLPMEYNRFENPHIYKIGISDGLKTERDKLINHYKK